MNIAVCDDEKTALGIISNALKELCPDSEISEFDSGSKIIDSKKKYDIVFLDIDMPDMNGMDTAHIIRNNEISEYIIFLTGHSEFMQKAFEVRAFRYLSKPLNMQELRKTISDIQNEIFRNRRIVIKTHSNIMMLNIADIVCIEAFGDGTYVYAKNEVYVCNKTLRQWIAELGDENFFQVHKSFVVSLKYIVRINKDSLEASYLSSPVPISRRNRNSLKSTFFDYVKNNTNIL